MRHRLTRHRRRHRWSTLALTCVLTGTTMVGAAGLADAGQQTPSAPSTGAGAAAADDEYQRGPDPTLESIRASKGDFAYEEETVARRSDFGGGTVFYPTDTSEGTFGAVALSPGLSGTQSSLSWYGQKLASNGFVVFTIDNLNPDDDQPPARGKQLLAALDYLTEESSVRDRIDPERLAVAGHSMGGGGALDAAASRPEIQAAVPLTPWHSDKSWPGVSTPTMIVGAEKDTVAPVSSHAQPIYESLTGASERAYLKLKGADHLAPMQAHTALGQYALSWLKRYVDDDTRYEQFLCPAPKPDAEVSDYRDSCPGS